MEGLRHEGEAEHGQRQPDRLADPHRRKERQHVAQALGDDARHQRRDRWAGRAGRDEQRAGEDEKRGEVHVVTDACDWSERQTSRLLAVSVAQTTGPADDKRRRCGLLPPGRCLWLERRRFQSWTSFCLRNRRSRQLHQFSQGNASALPRFIAFVAVAVRDRFGMAEPLSDMLVRTPNFQPPRTPRHTAPRSEAPRHCRPDELPDGKGKPACPMHCVSDGPSHPRTPPRPWLACSRCRGIKPFRCSEKFRLNANGKRLDAWLIYRCASCDNTWNRPVLERRNRRDIDPACPARARGKRPPVDTPLRVRRRKSEEQGRAGRGVHGCRRSRSACCRLVRNRFRNWRSCWRSRFRPVCGLTAFWQASLACREDASRI